MKRHPVHPQSNGISEEGLGRNLVSRCENTNKAPEKLKCSFTGLNEEYKKFSAFFFGATVIIVLLQTSYFLNSKVNDFTTRVNWYENSTTCEEAEKTMASLARVINAIALLNEMENNSKITKMIITEALEVQNTDYFEFMNQSSFLNVKNVIKALNSIVVQKNNMVKEVTMDLKKIAREKTTPLAKLGKIVFSDLKFYAVKSLSQDANSSVTNLELLIKKLNAPSSVPTNVYTTFNNFQTVTYFDLNADMHDTFQRLDMIVNTMQNASLFLVYIEKYKQITSMARLENNLKSLLSSVSIIKRSLEVGSKKRVMKQLFSIYRLMSTSFSTFDKQTLIGFPRGSEDMAILFKDLDELPLKKVLNEGKSLSELKSLLQPILNLSSEIARAENIWNGPMRIQYANIIRQNVKVYQKMEKFNITAITSFLHILNASSEKPEPIGDLNSSALDEFEQHLISLQAFSNYRIKSRELKKIIDEADFVLDEYLTGIDTKIRALPLENDKIDLLKKENLGRLKPLLLKVKNITNFFDRPQKEIEDLFRKISGFKYIFTERMLTEIEKTVEAEQLFKPDTNEILNNIKFIYSLTPLTGEELFLIDKLPETFLAVKNQINKWHTLEETVKTETRKTKGYIRLKGFPYSWELASQLTYWQRTLNFFKRRDQRDMFHEIFKNGLALAEKIKSLPQIEKQLAGTVWDNFVLLNESTNSFFAKIENMPCKMLIHEHNLSSIADTVSGLNDANISSFELGLLIASLDRLESISLDLSPEVSVFKKNIAYLQDLQFSIMRRKSSLSKLLTLADSFFKSLFSREIKSVTKGSGSPLNCIFSVIFISVFAMFIF